MALRMTKQHHCTQHNSRFHLPVEFETALVEPGTFSSIEHVISHEKPGTWIAKS
jgi:hypothetical protein